MANFYGVPGQRYNTRGGPYVADLYGYIPNVAANDAGDMVDSGAIPAGAGLGTCIGKIIGGNANSTADQPVQLFVPAGAGYAITKITGARASTSLTTAAGGFYTAAAKGGTVLVLAAQAYTAFTGPTVVSSLTVVAAQLALLQTANPIYWSLTTAQGAPATLDLFIFGDLLG